jgi:hypothetical protein
MIFKKIFIQNLPPDQILHIFKKHKNLPFSKTLLSDAQKAYEELISIVNPKGCYEIFNKNLFSNDDLYDLNFPKNADHIAFLCSTIGLESELLIKKYNKNLYKNLLIDTAASEIAEQTMISLAGIVKNQSTKKFYITSPRLSPGYGNIKSINFKTFKRKRINRSNV